MDKWVPLIGEDAIFCCKEEQNIHDKFAVAIVCQDTVVGHVPKILSSIFWKFLSLPDTSVQVQVTGKRVNRGSGYGLEIPVKFIFQGTSRAINWIRKRISEVDDGVQAKVDRCLKMQCNLLILLY